MRIKKIRLKEYKRFHDLTIDLGEKPKRIIALIGPNGCGKSSVFDGILYYNNVHQQIGNKGYKDSSYHSMTQSNDFNWQNIEIEFIEGSYDSKSNERQKIGKQNTLFSFRSPYRYNNNLRISESRATTDITLNNYGATTTSDLDDKMEDNYRRLYIKYNNYLNEEDCKPSEAKKVIIGHLNDSLENCLNLRLDSIGNIESSRGTLYFKKSDYLNSFDFNVLSSGEKEVFDILLDLYLRKEEYNDTIFLFDEPELHINTAIQRKLLIEINKLIDPNCQIWIATHSIGFLRALQEELKDECQIIEFKSDIPWASSVQILNPIHVSHSKWKDIFHTALDDLTGLISPKRIIYCEGRAEPSNNGEERGLDAIVYNNIFSEKYPDTLFISSGGNTELDHRSQIAIAILTKVFSKVEILLLKDRDSASGKQTSMADRDIYLDSNPTHHRMLERWEIENYLYDKEVLQEYCKLKDLQFDENAYDNFVTDIENQNLKDETGRIKTICNIIVSINQEKFKINLSEVINKNMKIYKALESCIFI